MEGSQSSLQKRVPLLRNPVTNLAASPPKGDGQAATALQNRDSGIYGVISIFLTPRTFSP